MTYSAIFFCVSSEFSTIKRMLCLSEYWDCSCQTQHNGVYLRMSGGFYEGALVKSFEL